MKEERACFEEKGTFELFLAREFVYPVAVLLCRIRWAEKPACRGENRVFGLGSEKDKEDSRARFWAFCVAQRVRGLR